MDLFVTDAACYSTTTPTKQSDAIAECVHTRTQQTSAGMMCLQCGVIIQIRLQIDQSFQQQQKKGHRRSCVKSQSSTPNANPFDILHPHFDVPVLVLSQVRQTYNKILADTDLHRLLRIDKGTLTSGLKAKAFVFVLIVKYHRLHVQHHDNELEGRWLKHTKIPRKLISRFFQIYDIWQSDVHTHIFKGLGN